MGEEKIKKKAVQKFWELNVYQRSRELTREIYSLTRTGSFARDFGLIDQLRRASVSIMSNIAEGLSGEPARNSSCFFMLPKALAERSGRNWMLRLTRAI